MRKLYILSLFTLLILFAPQAKAQTSLKIDSLGLDSASMFGPINPCSNVYFNVFVSTTGLSSTDSVSVLLYYGDGTVDSVRYPVYLGPPQGVYAYFSHTFLFPGTYSPMIVAIGPGGLIDTLVAKNLVTTISHCGNITGNIYFDTNNNCLNDAGDYPLYQRWVWASSGINKKKYYALTDVNGDYGVLVPNSAIYDVNVWTSILFEQSCPKNGLPSIFSPSSGNDMAESWEQGAGRDSGTIPRV